MIVECSSCSSRNRVPASRLVDKARCAACKAALLPSSHPVHVADAAELDDLISHAPVPVLVDFWAAWCGPCQAVAPELARIARERAGSIVVGKVDTDALPDVAGRYGIRGIPTMILFRGGQEAKRVSGAMPASEIAARLSI